MEEQVNRSDALFETLNKNKKKRRRKIIVTVLSVIAVIAVLLTGVVFYLRHRVQERFAAAEADVQAYTVTAGSISTVVSGTGVLTQEDLEDIRVPEGVEITEVFVETRDTVQKGDILATVDMASVMTALSGVQEQLEELDDEIADAKGDTVKSYISAGVSGRVKRLYARKDTDVTACMAENGALALISLDGYMAVDIETGELAKGETVIVTGENGSVLSGTVETALGGHATVLVTDDGTFCDEQVTVFHEDGRELGTGSLYIHNPLAVTGYAGTVQRVNVQENAKVYKDTTLFQLTDTSFSANYDTLLRQRGELEETLMELLTIYRDGAVLAPMDGVMSTVLYDEDGAEDQRDIGSLFPNEKMVITVSVDETDILALQKGQAADVVVSSVSEEVLPGEVTGISKEATTASGVTTYSADITLAAKEGMLPGMTADVDVKIQGVEDALIIPVDALHQTSAIYYVYTSYDSQTQQYGGMTEVTVGMQNDHYAEILTGLHEGNTVFYTERKQDIFSMMMGMSGMGNMGGMSGMSGMGGAASQRQNMGPGGPGGQR